MKASPPDLSRFVQAQEGVYASALAELQRGRKTSHWMWFVFPQIAGLGFSPMAQRYALGDVEAARAYLADPVLGPRLRECTQAAMGEGGRSASQLFGYPDDLKFRSSMTLFELAAPQAPLFGQALSRLCGGARDDATLRLVDG